MDHTLTGYGIRWTSPNGEAGVQFDPLSAQHAHNSTVWSIWAGSAPNQPTWAITASPHAPSSLLATLTETLAQETDTRAAKPGRKHGADLTANAPAAPTAGASLPTPRSR
ncbi:DUF317 domain-containing protein [Streptomyces sp. NPDC001828]|uniref:DUF317 domain-containing protein n=1 Tax=Streptomyces sp. NPDC001828 TaxID=3364615 RepID=UPI003691A3AC